MRSRPDVDVRFPSVVHPGDELAIEILLQPGSETPIDFVDLTWSGEERILLASSGEQLFRSRSVVEKTIRLLEAGTLQPSPQRHRATFEVPRDAPGSYMGVVITVRYAIHLHVSIPWWPDLRETFEVTVEPHPTLRPKPAPATKASPRKGEAFMELSLADTAFAVGDEIAGAFAVGDLPRSDGLGVEVSLVAIELANDGQHTSRAEQFRHMAPSVFRATRSGVEVPFRFRVPKDAVPTFRSEWCDLSWLVQATLRTGWTDATSCTIPVTIGRFGSARDAAKDRPRIGAERWRKLWREVGETHGLALRGDSLTLTGSRGEVQIEVTRDESDDAPMLVATLRYPPLEIGLRVKGRFLVLRPSPLETRLQGYGVESREREQADAFFTEPLCEALRHFKDMRVDDARAVVRSASGGLDAPSLEAFLRETSSLADALGEALSAVPPPRAMKAMLPAWQSFASATGGHLAVGGMALFSASVDGAVFDVTTSFDEGFAPAGTRVTLDLDPPLDFRVDMKDLATFSAAPPGAKDLALALAGTVEALEINPYSIQIRLPTPTPDPADLRPRMGELLLLARRLRGERTPGPYR